jgi:uncharacterized 2Fe-2S/4Fe-4S cluster protein (DUF4445 family)
MSQSLPAFGLIGGVACRLRDLVAALRDIFTAMFPELRDIKGEWIRMLMGRSGAFLTNLKELYLARAFGSYINRASGQRIGLISFPSEKVEAAGNTALLGAKLALFQPQGEDGSFAGLRQRTEHVALNADQGFQDTFVEEMAFPQSTYA